MRRKHVAAVICMIVILLIVYIAVHFFPFPIHYPENAIICLSGEHVGPPGSGTYRIYLTAAESKEILELLPCQTAGLSARSVEYSEDGWYFCLQVHDPERLNKGNYIWSSWFYLDKKTPSRSLYQYDMLGLSTKLKWCYKLPDPDQLVHRLLENEAILSVLNRTY